MVMKKFLLAFFAICFMYNSFAQNRKKDQEVDIIDHQVQQGESIRLISKKYLVDPSEIYKLNKFAVEGISQGMVLKIPVPRKETALPKETVVVTTTEIASNKIQGTSTEDKNTKTGISNESPTPNSDIKKIVIVEAKTEINHKVTAKETLYSLAKDFNISVDDIKANNADILKNGLKIGQIIKIPTEKTIDVQQTNAVDETITSKTENTKPIAIQENSVPNSSENNVIHHKVAPKETLYSLSKKYNVAVDDIRRQNEALLKNGMQIGQILTIIIKKH